MSQPTKQTKQRAGARAARRRRAAEAVIAAYLRDISVRRPAPRVSTASP
jgi:hypothetical protein